MYCSRCGALLNISDAFCAKCGAHTAVAAPNATTANDRLWKARLLVGVAWVILLVVLLVNLHPIAAVIGIVASFIFAIGWSIRSIPPNYKFLFVVISLGLVSGAQWIDVTVAEHQQARLAEQAKQSAAQNAEALRLKAQQEQQAFDRMTPSQHLVAAKQDLVVNAPNSQVADGMRHLNTLQTTALESQAKSVRAHYEAQQAEEDRRIQAANAANARKAAAQDEKLAELGRDKMAKTIEDGMLEQGYDMTVTAVGPGHKTLLIKYVLVNKPFAYQAAHSPEITDTARSAGFTKIVLDDEYDTQWTIKLQ